MKIFQLSTFAFALLFTFSLQAQNSLPAVKIKSMDGQSVDISDFANNGKITVLSFWATWCSPCKRELDAISEYYHEWQEEYGMELVAVTIDDARALPKVRPMVQTKGWEYTILSDVNQDLQRALNFQSVPMTFLLNQDGEIVYTHSGYNPGDEFELEDKIKELNEKE